MNKAKFFALSSRHETFGVVFIEALACGIPILTTKSGGHEEFVNKTNGIICTVDNIQCLKEGLFDLYKNSNNYNPDIIIKEIQGKYDRNKIAKKILTAYKNILKEILSI